MQSNSSNSTLDRAQHLLPTVLLGVFVLVEFYSKYQRYLGHTTQVQKVVKAAGLAILLGLLTMHLAKIKKAIGQLVILIGIFAAGQFFTDPQFSQGALISFSRFLFPIILYLFFEHLRMDQSSKALLFRLFEAFLVLNFLCILLGLFTDIYVLKTYMGDRFGYNGLLLTSSTSTYVYICALGYFYFQYGMAMFRNWKFWLALASCLFIGTKSLYLGVVLFMLLVFAMSSFKYKKPLLVLGVLGFLGGLYVLFYQVPQFAEITEQDGLLSSLLSYRDQLLLEQTLPYVNEQWGAVNYLFGGVSDFSLRSQMDLVDLTFFWGVLGALAYLLFYLSRYFTFRLERKQLLFFILMAVVVIFAGNFFTYTSIPIYMVILREAALKSTP